MTDLLVDQLLAETREAEPFDDGFVRAVMADVHADQRRRIRMKLVRRPVVFGVAAAVLATSGAVAALVGTHVAPSEIASSPTAPRHARVGVVARAPSTASRAVVPSASATVSPPRTSSVATETKGGLTSLHTAYVIDKTTGLKLTTETYTNDFIAGKAQNVTLTLLNTSANPIVVSGMNNCALAVVATPAGEDPSAPVCASGGITNDSVLLAPGGFYTANAAVTLPSAGRWTIVGSCTCSYSDPSQGLTTKSSPFSPLLDKAAPQLDPNKSSPGSGVAKLATPPIGVEASR
jgi:hypothetical protein